MRSPEQETATQVQPRPFKWRIEATGPDLLRGCECAIRAVQAGLGGYAGFWRFWPLESLIPLGEEDKPSNIPYLLVLVVVLV